MLKAGFIGAGGRGQSAHYPSVHRLADQVEMAAVCELDEERRVEKELQQTERSRQVEEELAALKADKVS